MLNTSLPGSIAERTTCQISHGRASRCNRHKGTNLSAVDPDSGKVVFLFNTRAEKWEGHFEIALALILGTSAVGRATAQLLKMNADRRVELRYELINQGLWES